MVRKMFFVSWLGLLLVSAAWSQVPRLISYQGLLADNTGKPVPDGEYHLILRLYDAPTGGKVLWQEEQNTTVTGGIFEALLGRTVPLNLPFDRPYWLGITVGSGTELTPRIPLTGTGYAIRAVYADSITGIAAGGDLAGSYPNPVLRDSSVTAAKIADGAVTQQKLAPDVSLPPGGPAGGDLTGTYPNPVLRDSSVTTAKIADGAVTSAKLAPDASLPPGGEAGGDLTGSYPSPQIARNAIDSTNIVDGGISAEDVGFNFAASNSKGGAAKTLALPFDGSGSTDWSVFKIENYGSGNALHGVGRIGVFGESQGGLGLYGWSVDSVGVVGESYGQAGVYGRNVFTHTYGYLGSGSYAVYGEHGANQNSGYIGGMTEAIAGYNGESHNFGKIATANEGVYGECKTPSGAGVKGYHRATGNSGMLATKNAGIQGNSVSANGVEGYSVHGYGIYGRSQNQIAIMAETAGEIGNPYAVYGKNLRSKNVGILGTYREAVFGVAAGSANIGVYGINTTSGVLGYLASNQYGVYGKTPPGTGQAGHFEGNVEIIGNFTVTGTKSFKIDHPLDPEGKYLQHYCLESDEVLNVYSGNVTLDAGGEAEVQLPDWFEAINGDFRYQLTCVGGYAPVYIAEKISGNRFRIAGGRPGLEVSWQVTAVRQDRWVKAHPPQVEITKPPEEQGYYLQPELYGQPEERSVEWARNPELMRMLQQERQKNPGDLGPEGRK